MGSQALTPRLLLSVCVSLVSQPLPPLMNCSDMPTGPQERGLEAEWRVVPVMRGLELTGPAWCPCLGSWLPGSLRQDPAVPVRLELPEPCASSPVAPAALRPVPAPRPWPHGLPRALTGRPLPSQGVFFTRCGLSSLGGWPHPSPSRSWDPTLSCRAGVTSGRCLMGLPSAKGCVTPGEPVSPAGNHPPPHFQIPREDR